MKGLRSSERKSAPRNTITAPPLRQRQFPSRKRYAIPKINQRATRQLKKEQSTLTQLNYIVPSSYRSDEDEVSEPNEEPSKVPYARKRRKLDSNTEQHAGDIKQSTLTQWEWLEGGFLTDETEDEAGEERNLEHTQDHKEGLLSCVNDSQQASEDEWTPQKPYMKGEPLSSSAQRSPSPEMQKPEGPESDQMIQRQANPGVSTNFVTPQKTIKREIPSSQSPSATPLRTQEESHGPQRTPLQEIPPNVLALLDESPSRRLSASRETPTGITVEDKENVRDSLMDQEAMRKSEMPSNKGNRNFDIETSPRRKESYDMPPPGDSHYTVSPPRNFNQNTIRSSQATTVDITQQSPNLESPDHSTVDYRSRPRLPSSRRIQTPTKGRPGPRLKSSPVSQPPTPMPFESQFPFSCISGVDPGDYSPLSSIQDSADIVTVSQLLPESMINDSQDSEED